MLKELLLYRSVRRIWLLRGSSCHIFCRRPPRGEAPSNLAGKCRLEYHTCHRTLFRLGSFGHTEDSVFPQFFVSQTQRLLSLSLALQKSLERSYCRNVRRTSHHPRISSGNGCT